MSNGAYISYQYSGGMLIKVTVRGEGGEGSLTYDYLYSNGMLSRIIDATGENPYYIKYHTDKKTSVCMYPNSTKLCIEYNEDESVSTYTKQTSGNNIIYEGFGKYNSDGYFTSMREGSSAVNGGALYTFKYNNHKMTASNKTVTYNTLVDNRIQERLDLVGDIFEYEREGNITKEQYGDGSEVTYVYGLTGEITKNLPTEIIKTYKRDDSSKEEKLAHVVLTYDEKGNVLSLYDKIENDKINFVYDNAGNITSQTSTKEGNEDTKVKATYDKSGNVVTEEVTSGSVNTKISYTYDAMGRVRTERDKDGNFTLHEYDSFGRKIQVTEKYGSKELVTKKSYDKNGNLTKEISPSGEITVYDYDSLNRVVSQKVTADGVASYTYTSYKYTDINIIINSDNDVRQFKNLLCTTVKDSNGNVISMTYTDDLGHVIREQSHGVCTDSLFDNQGNVVSSIIHGESEKTGTAYAYSYDVNGNMTAVLENAYIHGNGTIYAANDTVVKKTVYDGLGNVLSTIDGLGNTTSYSYSEDKKLTAVALPGDNKLSRKYEYRVETDEGYFADKITDIKGNKSVSVRNAAGQTMYIADYGTDNKSIKTSYQYDYAGNVVKQTNGNGSYIKYTYDGRMQCLREQGYDKNGVMQNDTHYAYDKFGNISRMDDFVRDGKDMVPSGSTFYVYNQKGLVIAEGQLMGRANPDDAEIESALTHYSYDKNDMLVRIDYPAGSKGVTAEYFEYDKNMCLKCVKADIAGKTEKVTLCTYTYTGKGRVKSEVYNLSPASSATQQLVKSYAYDKLDRITSIEYSKGSGGAVFEKYLYEYDKNGNIIKETINGEKNEIREYTYTQKGQLSNTAVTVNGAKSTPYHYTYDSVGNCISVNHGYLEEMEYNGLNQLVKKVEHTGKDITTNYTYDGSGNQIKSELTNSGNIVRETLAYDSYNRLVTESRKVGQGAETLIQRNLYNGAGKRISSTFTDESQKTVTENYHYINGQLSHISNENGTVNSKYIYDGKGNAILREENANTTSVKKYCTYTKDIRGSVRSLLSETGSRLISYDYDDYGGTDIKIAAGNTSKTGFDNHICFTGGVYDKATGKYYLNARYYDPSTMNFLSQDSYRGTADDSATWNLYSYCAGNPVGYVDPSGHIVVAIPFTEIVIEAVFAFVLTASAHNIDVQQRKNIEWFLNDSPEASQYATWSDIKKELGYENDSNVEGKHKTKAKPRYIRENDVPKDSETVLKNKEYVRTNKTYRKARIYKKGKRFYYRDTQHVGRSAHLEVFDINGKHLGEADPLTGKLRPNTADKSKILRVK